MGGFAELNPWYDANREMLSLGATNFGVFTHYLHSLRPDVRIRAGVGLGLSVLNQDLPGTSAGNVGLYANIRLLGIVWYFANRTALTIDAFDLALPAPQLRGWPVLYAQHRISVGLSFSRGGRDADGRPPRRRGRAQVARQAAQPLDRADGGGEHRQHAAEARAGERADQQRDLDPQAGRPREVGDAPVGGVVVERAAPHVDGQQDDERQADSPVVPRATIATIGITKPASRRAQCRPRYGSGRTSSRKPTTR